MKSTFRVTFSIVTFLTAIALSVAAGPSYDIGLSLASAILIAFGGFVISLTVAVWKSKGKKMAFSKNLEISFGISSLIYILGYLYIALQPVILQ